MTQQGLTRGARRRLATIRHAEEVTDNVALTCRSYGISRQCYRAWSRRYQATAWRACGTAPAGRWPAQHHPHRGRRQGHLPAPARPLRPGQGLHVPQALPRRPGQPLRRVAGPQTPWPQPAPSLPAAQRHQRRYEQATARPPRPALRHVHRAAGRITPQHDQFTAIHDGTRLRVLRTYPQRNQQTAIQFADDVLERLPLRVEVIQTGNGAEFQSLFHWHVLDKGVGHDDVKAHTPRRNGKVERSHRIDAEEFYQLLDGVVTDDTEVFNDKLREWEDFHNYHRPHGSLGGQTPHERRKQRAQTPA